VRRDTPTPTLPAASAITQAVSIIAEIGSVHDGSFGNALKLEAAYALRLRGVATGATLEQGVLATATATARLGARGRFAFTGRAEVQLEWWAGRGAAAIATLGVDLD